MNKSNVENANRKNKQLIFHVDKNKSNRSTRLKIGSVSDHFCEKSLILIWPNAIGRFQSFIKIILTNWKYGRIITGFYNVFKNIG